MLSSSRLTALITLMAGAVLGWLAGSGRLQPAPRAEAALGTASRPPAKEGAAPCCEQGAGRGMLLARAQDEKKETGKDGKKPNILVIWGDDIGWFNPSCYHQGIMGYQTPNIDRIAKEGRGSPTGTGSRAAPPAGPRSSPARVRSAPG
jgi:hypothetical protein